MKDSLRRLTRNLRRWMPFLSSYKSSSATWQPSTLQPHLTAVVINAVAGLNNADSVITGRDFSRHGTARTREPTTSTPTETTDPGCQTGHQHVKHAVGVWAIHVRVINHVEPGVSFVISVVNAIILQRHAALAWHSDSNRVSRLSPQREAGHALKSWPRHIIIITMAEVKMTSSTMLNLPVKSNVVVKKTVKITVVLIMSTFMKLHLWVKQAHRILIRLAVIVVNVNTGDQRIIRWNAKCYNTMNAWMNVWITMLKLLILKLKIQYQLMPRNANIVSVLVNGKRW